MEQVNAFWEKRNIGVDACELIISENEPEIDALEAILNAPKYPYMVAKLPVCRARLVEGLEAAGWKYIETQFIIENSLKGTEFLDLSDSILLKINETKFESMKEFELKELYQELEEGAFTTDRIYLDSAFDKKCASKRYINWIKDLIQKGVIPCKVIYKDEIIGFFIFGDNISKTSGQAHLILAGLYKKFIGKGLGILLETSVIRYAKEKGASSVITGCSSNNIPVIKIFLSIGYKIKTLNTVMVKHN